jgi:hypothetical protein
VRLALGLTLRRVGQRDFDYELLVFVGEYIADNRRFGDDIATNKVEKGSRYN